MNGTCNITRLTTAGTIGFHLTAYILAGVRPLLDPRGSPGYQGPLYSTPLSIDSEMEPMKKTKLDDCCPTEHQDTY